MLNLLFFACALIAGFCVAAEPSVTEKLPDFPPPACLGKDLEHDGRAIFYKKKALPLDKVPEKLAGAAYYENAGVLMLVLESATIVLYEFKDNTLVEKSKHVNDKIKLTTFYYARVPGLLYTYGIQK